MISLFRDAVSADNPLDSSPDGAAPKKPLADLLTVQALTNFPLAAGVVTTAWQVVQKLVDASWETSAWTPMAIAGFLVFGIWLSSFGTLKTAADRLGGLVIGTFNAALLAAAVLGLEVQFLS